MEYIKFHIDEMDQEFVFCEYREITEDKKGPLKSRAFPFSKIIEKEPKIQELVDGPITGIYYEQRGNNTTSERQWIDRIEPLEQETIDWIIILVKKICIEEVYDELLKPPTIDEQVEDFIKEFFEEGDSEPLEQKDFLAEFFEELEPLSQNSPKQNDPLANFFEEDSDNTLNKRIEERFNNTSLETVDFLAEFFEQLDDDEV
jgi:hypothetical protein|tara:strand:- start:2361 stop:2966 length:606 start_codon:yes stop_codon:yes gene_type:complete